MFYHDLFTVHKCAIPKSITPSLQKTDIRNIVLQHKNIFQYSYEGKAENQPLKGTNWNDNLFYCNVQKTLERLRHITQHASEETETHDEKNTLKGLDCSGYDFSHFTFQQPDEIVVFHAARIVEDPVKKNQKVMSNSIVLTEPSSSGPYT